jgi:hypothetical protein
MMFQSLPHVVRMPHKWFQKTKVVRKDMVNMLKIHISFYGWKIVNERFLNIRIFILSFMNIICDTLKGRMCKTKHY